MYDIKIFLEEDGCFGGKLTVGNETIYGIGKTQEELYKSLIDGLDLSFPDSTKNEKILRLKAFLSHSNENVCH